MSKSPNYYVDTRKPKEVLMDKNVTAWILLGILGIPRYAMGLGNAVFGWPGNYQMTQLSSQQPVGIMDLTGKVHLEYKGLSVPFDPWENPKHTLMLLKGLRVTIESPTFHHGWGVRNNASGTVYEKELEDALVRHAITWNGRRFLVPRTK